MSGPAPRSADPLSPGQPLLGGRFRIVRLLGRGGMGAVYAAEDRERGGEVALKTLFDADPTRFLRLKHEFRSLRDLSHPHLVELYELFQDGDLAFFTMERVVGPDFLAWVRPGDAGPFDERKLRDALRQLAHALRVLHRAGKVHRDVKPTNTLVEEARGRVVLVDCGLIAELDGLFGTAERAGTLAYMAPEQCAGRPPAPEADWYSVGVMLFEALTGRLPFEGQRAELSRPEARRSAPSPAELAADLPADLVTLCRDLLAFEPARRAGGVEVLGRLERSASPAAAEVPLGGAGAPFVGRRHALSVLQEALDEVVRTGAPALVHVRGESGIGKSALLQRFREDRGRDAVVVESRCHAREHVPYKALEGLVEVLAAQPSAFRGSLRRAERRALGRLFPALAPAEAGPLPAETAPEEADPVRLRRHAFIALRELLSELAASGPLVMIVDDAQWADADSFVVLETLLAGPEPLPWLCVLASRADWDARAVEDLPVRARSLALEPLPPEEARALVGALEVVPRRHVDRIVAMAHGHPLFLAELARQSEGGEAARGLDETLLARVDALPSEERTLFQLLSVAGRPLAPRVLADAMGCAPEALAGCARRLELARLARSTEQGGRLEPYHDRLRRAVLKRLEEGSRRSLHLRLARSTERHEPAAAEVLAEHWSAAEETARARGYAVQAAEMARDALAFEKAAKLFDRALDLGGAAGPEAARLFREKGQALAHAGRGLEAARAYRRAAPLVGPAEAADLERLAAEQLLRAGHIDAGLSAVDGALRRAGMTYPRTRAGALIRLAGELARLRLAGSRPSVRGSVPGAVARLETCWAAAVGLAQIEPLTSALFQARFLRLSRELGDLARIALGLSMAAAPAASGGAPARRAERLIAEAKELATRSEDPRVSAYVALAETHVAFLTGRFEDALHHGERAVAAFRACTGLAWELATAQRLTLDALWHTGRLAELTHRVRDVMLDARDRGDVYALTQLQTTVLPVVRLADDEVALAEGELAEALSNWSRAGFFLQHWQHMQGRALTLMYQRRFDEALAFIDARMAEIGRTFLFRIQAIRIFTHLVQGTAAVGAALESPSRRRALLRRAVREARALDRERAPYAPLLHGQIAALAGRPGATVHHLSQAREALGKAGIALTEALCARSLGRRLHGDEGLELEARAERFLAGQPLARPGSFLGMLAPVLAAD